MLLDSWNGMKHVPRCPTLSVVVEESIDGISSPRSVWLTDAYADSCLCDTPLRRRMGSLFRMK